MIGEPDAGNPHVRFDEGRQETCVSRGAPVSYSTRHGRRDGPAFARAFTEQLSDAEVQQLRRSLRRYENIRWFEVPMHHQVSMRVRNRFADAQEQQAARLDRESALTAEKIDRLALDELHHEKRPSVGGRSTVV